MSVTYHIALNILIACPVSTLRQHVQISIQQRLPYSKFSAVSTGIALQTAIETASMPYDVLILDAALPELNYAQLWECLHTQALQYPQPMVLLGTAASLTTELPDFFPTDMVSYLQKPVDGNLLANQMHGYAYFIERAKQLHDTQSEHCSPDMPAVGTASHSSRRAQQLQQLEHEAQQLAEQVALAKLHFLENLSQELHPPLQAILQFSELLKTEAAGTASVASQQNLDNICAASAELLAFVEELQTIQAASECLSAAQLERLVAFETLYQHRAGNKTLH